ncbi:MAG: hypothetical protein ACFB14_07045 [Leptolyngbyaceae cyanobacterium]
MNTVTRRYLDMYQSWWLVAALSGFVAGIVDQSARTFLGRLARDRIFLLRLTLGGIMSMSLHVLGAFAIFQTEDISAEQLSALMIKIGVAFSVASLVWEYIASLLRRRG